MEKSELEWVMEYRDMLAEERLLKGHIQWMEGQLNELRERMRVHTNLMGAAGVNLREIHNLEPHTKPGSQTD